MDKKGHLVDNCFRACNKNGINMVEEMEWVSRKCSEFLLKNKAIPEDEFEIYVYGFDFLFTTTLSAISILILASPFKSFLNGVIFILTFFIMRMFAGGYHAETHWGCFLVTNTVFLLSLVLDRVFLPYLYTVVSACF